jgi:hypothetical protein
MWNPLLTTEELPQNALITDYLIHQTRPVRPFILFVWILGGWYVCKK